MVILLVGLRLSHDTNKTQTLSFLKSACQRRKTKTEVDTYFGKPTRCSALDGEMHCTYYKSISLPDRWTIEIVFDSELRVKQANAEGRLFTR